MKKDFISFDLGLNFGYADKNTSGNTKLGKKNRMIDFYNKVLDIMLNGNRYEAIVYEDACFQRGVAIYNFNAQKGMLQLVAESFNIPFIGYPPATVKKAFTGSGKAKKPDMIKKANEVRLDTIKNDNEADAIGVYHTHLLLGDK